MVTYDNLLRCSFYAFITKLIWTESSKGTLKKLVDLPTLALGGEKKDILTSENVNFEDNSCFSGCEHCDGTMKKFLSLPIFLLHFRMVGVRSEINTRA